MVPEGCYRYRTPRPAYDYAIKARGEDDPDSALSELDRRIDEGTSPSEEMLREYRQGGFPRLLEIARL
jgi:hypothetical protein